MKYFGAFRSLNNEQKYCGCAAATHKMNWPTLCVSFRTENKTKTKIEFIILKCGVHAMFSFFKINFELDEMETESNQLTQICQTMFSFGRLFRLQFFLLLLSLRFRFLCHFTLRFSLIFGIFDFNKLIIS